MFASGTISTRLTALCGVALAVVASLQQVHALCVVTGCTPLPAVTCQAGGTCTEQATSCCCHASQAAVEDEQPIAQEQASDSRSDSPCHQDCWCCKPAPPQQQNTAMDTMEIAQPAGSAWDQVAHFALGTPLTVTRQTLGEISPATAHEQCATLCRFLI